MDNPLLRKLQNFVRLSEADRRLLGEATRQTRQAGARRSIVLEGDDPCGVHVVLEGWAVHAKQFDDGRQQIVSILLPGDCCDPQIFRLDRIDHGLTSVTPVTFAYIPSKVVRELTARSPALSDAFHCEQLVATAILREWVASLGRRSAIERIAHLLYELRLRLSAVGLAEGPCCPMPLTQVDLADALGQTSVHVNRTLQDLRGTGLISLQNRRLTILDENGLRKLAHFDPAYLHLGLREGRPAPPAED